MKKTISVAIGSEPKLTTTWYNKEGFLTYRGGATIYIDHTSIDTIIKKLKALSKEYSKEYTNIRIRSIKDCGCMGDCDCNPRHYVYGDRLENDLEYNYRKDKEAKEHEEKERRERVEYERLQALYGKDK